MSHGDGDADRVFLETTRRFATPRLAALDVESALRLSALSAADLARGPLADLGCGYGRHLVELGRRGCQQLIGVDRSPLLLAEARRLAPRAALIRSDLRALGLGSGALAGAFCFYSSMFLGSHEDARQALAEARRALRPGAPLVLTTDNPLRMARAPDASFADELPGLGVVSEESRYDAARRIDRVMKKIQSPSGESLSACFEIRYYPPAELAELARSAGLRLVRLEPDAPLTEETPQLMALLSRAPG